MTQQNETEQQGAAEPGPPGQTAPAGPGFAESGDRGTGGEAIPPHSAAQAPKLYGYESVPEAYLAPPQPGQPRYGTPRQIGSGRPFVGGPGYSEPGYGQRADGQPGLGRPAGGRPVGGTAAQRDPALAPPWQRLVAQAIDWIIIFTISIFAFWSQLSIAGQEAEAVVARYPGGYSPAAQAAFNSVIRSSSVEHALIYWFLGTLGIALAYYWVQHAAWGATVGKRTLGMRVVRAADRSRLDVGAAGLRTAVFLAGPAIFLLLTFISPLSVVGGALWAADSSLPLLDPRAQSLHDKLAGTIVVRQRALDESARRSSTS